MQDPVIITCAITGNITTRAQHPSLPVTPDEIAQSALEAAEAGAAVAHIHVRDPATGGPSMDLELYRAVVETIRARNADLVLNLTTGLGGRFVPGDDDPKVAGPGTSLTTPERRVAHVPALTPEICTLDLNTMNSGAQVVINTPKSVTRMAAIIRAARVTPELEVFDSGDIEMAKALISDGVLEGPGLFTIVMGVKFGFPATPETLFYARSLLPPGAVWSAFGIGRSEFPMVGQAWLAGGHVRVGLEDNIYLSKGVLAPSNAALVERARQILEPMGARIATPAEARRIMGLPAARSRTAAE